MKGTVEYDEQEVWSLVEECHTKMTPPPYGYIWEAGEADYMGRGVKVTLVKDDEAKEEA